MSDTISVSSTQQSKTKKMKGQCLINEVPVDAIRKILGALPAPAMFLCFQTARIFCCAQDDTGFWTNLLKAEFDSSFVLNETAGTFALKRTYRERARLWISAVELYEWLVRIGYPCDVSGTRNGIPLRQTVLSGLAATLTLTAAGLSQPRRHRLRDIALPCLASLVQSSSSSVRERAASALASLARQGEHGAAFLVRRGLLRPLRAMLFDSCLGHQKQASRLLVNALIDPARRVLRPCPSTALRSPHRGAPPQHPPGGAGAGDAGVLWVCVEFSPGGQAGAPHDVRLWATAAGKLCGSGVDELGRYTLHEATLDRALEWQNGPSVEHPPAPAGARPSSAPAARGSAPGNEVVDRMRGYQARYMQGEETAGAGGGPGGKAAGEGGAAASPAAAAAGLLLVSEGAAHVELYRSHAAAHGRDHVRLTAFADAGGLWGLWERGRFHFHNRIDGGTRGVFRMWPAGQDGPRPAAAGGGGG